MSLTDAVDLTQFDPFSEVVQQDPVPWWREMRRRGPLYHHGDDYFVVTYDAVESVLLAPEDFSSKSLAHQRTTPDDPQVVEQVAAIRGEGWPEVPALLTQDAPVHRRQRVLVNKAFSAKRVKETEPFIVDLVDELTTGLVKAGGGDFIEVFSKPLPLRLIASLLSVPDDNLPNLKRWTDNRFANIANKVDAEGHLRIARSEVERQHYFNGLLDARRGGAGGEDLLTALVEARIDEESGEGLSTEELLTMVGMLMAAGNETSTSLLSQTMLHLAHHPKDWEFLKDDPAANAPLVVEEALRMFSPTQMMPRIATRDLDIDGTTIPEGSVVQVVFASASRDEDHFSDPDVFDPLRPNVREHFGFGRGPHLCLGASLTRIQASIALVGLAEAVDSFRVLDEVPRYHASFRQRGLAALRIEVDPA